MTLQRIQRPASVALAVGASALLLVGALPAGLVVGAAAVAAAWVPVRKADPVDD